ncbi:10113_t:CDS:2, partial [Gigaspora rosea]
NETVEQRNARLAKEREQKRQRRSKENSEEHEKRLKRDRDYKKKRLETETAEQRDERLKCQSERMSQLRTLRSANQEQNQNSDLQQRYDQPSVTEFDASELCTTEFDCRNCYSEKISPNKFSNENNMDPGEVPEELQGLTEIEEMLIAKVFTVISVYRLREILVVRRQSTSNLASFRDFTVRRNKVACALHWLKTNNRYYNDISIDNEVLQSLPDNGSIIEELQQIQDDESDENLNDNENDYSITRTFVPALPSSHREDIAINNTLNRVQAENSPLIWPQID